MANPTNVEIEQKALKNLNDWLEDSHDVAPSEAAAYAAQVTASAYALAVIRGQAVGHPDGTATLGAAIETLTRRPSYTEDLHRR
jgi:type 1 glutamine amidotransferase